MGNYYEEILGEIRNDLEEGKYEEGMMLVKRELEMPYIPTDVEPQLKKLKRELQYRMSEGKEGSEASLDSLLNRLKGKPESQLAAAAALTGRNLRDCLDEIGDWLSKDPFPEAAALLIEAIAEQGIQDEFTYMKDGVEYSFYGDSVTPVAESEGFLDAEKYLRSWLANDHPDMYEMAKTLLIHEAYMFLPLAYDADDAKDLAVEMALQVADLMGDDELADEIRRNAGISQLFS